MSNEELIKLIEMLGDDLGEIIDLTESIYNTVKQKFGINSNTLGMWKLHIKFQHLSEDFTDFHTRIFKELEKK